MNVARRENRRIINSSPPSFDVINESGFEDRVIPIIVRTPLPLNSTRSTTRGVAPLQTREKRSNFTCGGKPIRAAAIQRNGGGGGGNLDSSQGTNEIFFFFLFSPSPKYRVQIDPSPIDLIGEEKPLVRVSK